MDADEARKFEGRVEYFKNPANWRELEGEEFRVALVEALAIFSLCNDQTMIAPLKAFYDLAVDRLPPESRLTCERQLAQWVGEGRLGASALMPFVYSENDPSTVVGAVLDLAYFTATQNDPLAGVRELIKQMSLRQTPNVGAVFGGLIALGDDRITEMLKPLRNVLDQDEINTAAKCTYGIPNVAGLEFWLDWLEHLSEEREGHQYGCCATALPMLLRGALVRGFSNRRRDFGSYARGEHERPLEPHEVISFEEIGRRYADRLYALEARESPPKLMSDVIRRFGLLPRAAENEQYRSPPEDDKA